MNTTAHLLTDTELLNQVREMYPNVYSVKVDRIGHVWCYCDPVPDWSGWGSNGTGGTFRLGSSSTSARLERAILEWRARVG
jgi:hypothetical protein